jgi:opacity protein-like surface antigen
MLGLLLLGVGARTETANADDLSGAYLGGNFGRARNNYDTGNIDGQISSAAAESGDSIDFTDRSIQKMSDAWWFDAGYFFTQYVGIDAAFLHIGDIKYVAVGTVTASGGNQSLSTWNEISSHGPALSLILRLPLSESFEADLRVGDYFGKSTWDNTLSFSSHSDYARQSNSDSSLLAGLGASYTFAGHWSLRLDYLRVNQTGDSNTTGKFSVNLATAGVSYTF